MNIDYKAVFGLLSLLITTGMVGKLTSVPVEDSPQAVLAENRSALPVIGPVAKVGEKESTMRFIARVDTGAKTCSLHAAETEVLEGSSVMEENLGKVIRFRVENRLGESRWLERTIAEIRTIRTSEGQETRYLVPMTLTCDQVEREVLVSLNDRSQMSYTMLLGRNFLGGEFVVDVTGADEVPNLLASGMAAHH